MLLEHQPWPWYWASLLLIIVPALSLVGYLTFALVAHIYGDRIQQNLLKAANERSVKVHRGEMCGLCGEPPIVRGVYHDCSNRTRWKLR